MIRAVVFDLGQVLASPPDLHSEPARRLGVDADTFAAHYWDRRRDYDKGASEDAYWGALLAALGLPVTPDQIELLAATDQRLWMDLRPEAERLVADVAATGLTTALLSNAPLRFVDGIDAAPWRTHFDRVFVSGDLGLAKPERAVYDRVTADLGVPPEQIAFIDDRPENVAGADAAGWVAHLFVDDADTRSWLESLRVL